MASRSPLKIKIIAREALGTGLLTSLLVEILQNLAGNSLGYSGFLREWHLEMPGMTHHQVRASFSYYNKKLNTVFKRCIHILKILQ